MAARHVGQTASCLCGWMYTCIVRPVVGVGVHGGSNGRRVGVAHVCAYEGREGGGQRQRETERRREKMKKQQQQQQYNKEEEDAEAWAGG